MSSDSTTAWPDLVESGFVAGLQGFVQRTIAPDAERIDREDIYPVEAIKGLARAGYSTVFMPAPFGAGRGYRHALAVFEEVSYASAAVGISLITILQAQTILNLFGSASLQQRYLPGFGDGLIASYALTEANHGSDIRSLDTKAQRTADGWAIEGEKSFITSGSAAEVFVVLAQTEVGVSTFIVPRDAPGVTTYLGRNSATFGLRNGPHVNLRLDRVQLPADHLIGQEGKGVRQAVTTLDYSRTMAAGISLGIARAAFDRALEHARKRVVFDSTVFEKQGIQWYFADMLAQLEAARLLTYHTADLLDRGGDIARMSSEAKLLAAKLATEVCSTCIQVCGAYGVMENAPYGRFLRDAKAYEIAGGSAEVLRNTIGKSLSRLPLSAAAPENFLQ
ncbi:acyl-CoA dehydrogenase family protein [Pseudorhodoferax sp.]|uniref:acyl-CoA dehydrogenase family protein n=1 Tax=Pseudorhodoferax sp. TaxID=1993553 RepID=UPI002DD68C20|nr:acyl-CoA dehydrogenase family protein [Pseudorhodoferax sp.]